MLANLTSQLDGQKRYITGPSRHRAGVADATARVCSPRREQACTSTTSRSCRPSTLILDGSTREVWQYSVTEHVRHVTPGSGRGLPGVFFFYEVSPLVAEFEERRQGARS